MQVKTELNLNILNNLLADKAKTLVDAAFHHLLLFFQRNLIYASNNLNLNTQHN